MSGFCCAAHGSAATSNIAAARAEIISLISSHSSLIKNCVPDSPLLGGEPETHALVMRDRRRTSPMY
jgi:hypothetical protein